MVLPTSVGASSKQRLEELQKMDAKYVMNTITIHMNDIATNNLRADSQTKKTR